MYSSPDFDLCVAVSDTTTFEACLGRSPDVVTGTLHVREFRNHHSAAAALNAALDSSTASVVIIPHQDVYLPSGFVDNLARQLAALEAIDPNWAVVASIGIDAEGNVQGETWSSGIGRRVGNPVQTPSEVVTVDELILVVRTASGVRFDPDLPGFHLYGTDFVVTARERSYRSYVVSLPVIHHSRRLVKLGKDYWRAYLYLRRRWAHKLPVVTMFGAIHRSLLPLARVDLDYRIRNRGRSSRPAPSGDPKVIARRLGYEKT